MPRINFIKKWVVPPGLWEVFVKMHSKNAPLVLPENKKLLECNKTLIGRHKDERCFILGAGSSIIEQDLKKLKGECVISVSNTFVHPDYQIFRPKYHVLPHLIYGHGHLNPTEKFVEWLREMDEKTGDAEIFLHIGDKALIEENQIFKNRALHWNEYVPWDETCNFDIDLAKVPAIWSVSEYAITVALYLGFKEIYLIGFDHDWFNGPLVYFFDHNTQHKLQPNLEKISFADSEFQMRRHAYIFKKYKCLYQVRQNIFNANANPNHYLDVFPKVDYNSLFD
jgi:hypothetical protein